MPTTPNNLNCTHVMRKVLARPKGRASAAAGWLRYRSSPNVKFTPAEYLRLGSHLTEGLFLDPWELVIRPALHRR